MRVPLSWLREYARLPEPADATEVARRLTAAGLEVESPADAGTARCTSSRSTIYLLLLVG